MLECVVGLYLLSMKKILGGLIMKNIKRVFGVVALLAIVASFSVSCGQSRAQDVGYYNFLASLEIGASENEIKSERIKEIVKSSKLPERLGRPFFVV